MEASRWKFLKHLQYHGIFKAVLVIWTLLSIASTLTVVLPPSWAKYLVLFPLLSRWHWYVWVIGFLVIALGGTFESAYRAHNMIVAQFAAKETEMVGRLIAKHSEIERISKPDKCPVVLITEWRLGPVGVSLASGEPVIMNGGFHLQSEGETAHEITLEEFDIEPDVTVASRVVSSVVGHQIGQAFMLAWIKNQQVTDFSKFDLQSAFRRASDNRDSKMSWKPNYCCTLRLTYRDHSDFWYRTTQELAYIPANGRIEFGPIKHEKLGLRKSA